MQEPFVYLASGYVKRALAILPSQGSKWPWALYQNYVRDLLALRFGVIEDGTITFTKHPSWKARQHVSADAAHVSAARRR